LEQVEILKANVEVGAGSVVLVPPFIWKLLLAVLLLDEGLRKGSGGQGAATV
jgi:hypothetical protein